MRYCDRCLMTYGVNRRMRLTGSLDSRDTVSSQNSLVIIIIVVVVIIISIIIIIISII